MTCEISKLMLKQLGRSFLSYTTFNQYFYRIRRDLAQEMFTKFAPPVDRTMKKLDRGFFKKEVKLLVAYFPNPRYLGQFVKACKKDILFMPQIKHIVPVEDSKGVILRSDLDDLQTCKQHLSEVTLAKIDEFDIEIKPYTMELDYTFWKYDEILRAILPEDLLDDIPTGYSQAGHIAHINLRDEFKPYGSLIGEVILDKNHQIKTVVDKVGLIRTKFRTFDMQVLAGEDNFNVEQSESGCKFHFDFSKVYWNSRLSTEHDRLVSQFKPHEVVGDVFAGVGPFAVPAAKKDVIVLSNDLNPESYKYMNENVSINKVEKFIKTYNLDGRDFIKQSPKLLMDWYNTSKHIEVKKLQKKRKLDDGKTSSDYKVTNVEIPKFYTNYVMNLPDSALLFLDEFVGLYSDPEIKEFVKSDPNFKLPIINTHCFEKYSATEPEPSHEELSSRIHKKVVDLIKFDIPIEDCKFHLVRKVAPTKPMYCVSFQLPEEVAFREK